MKIYIDEDGDLGFTEKSSKFFIVSSLIPKDAVQIKKCLTKVRKQKLMKKYKEIPALKFHNSNKEIRRGILQCIAQCNVEINYAIRNHIKIAKKLHKSYVSQFFYGNFIMEAKHGRNVG